MQGFNSIGRFVINAENVAFGRGNLTDLETALNALTRKDIEKVGRLADCAKQCVQGTASVSQLKRAVLAHHSR